jgi:outer membrane biosynthesis protein TonB
VSDQADGTQAGMRTGLTISGVGHAVVLLWCVVTFIVQPYHAESMKGLPVDLISASEFSQMTDGAKNAPKAEKPKPVADKVAEAVPVEDPAAKLAKKEVKAATDVRAPEPKPPEPKVKKPPQPPAPTDAIADALKKDEKPEPKKPDPKPPTPPKKPAQQEPAPAFDPREVKALLDKRVAQRVASAADTELNTAVSPGAHGDGRKMLMGSAGSPDGLSDVEKAALRARLHNLWSAPPGMSEHKGMTIDVQFELNPDGTLAGPPMVLTRGDGPLFMAASDSVKRAVIQGAPYTMLRPEHYEAWRVLQAVFDPTDPL